MTNRERMTHRKRMVSEAASVIADLYEMGVTAPTVNQIVEQMVDDSVSDAISPAMRATILTEVGNIVSSSFRDICQAAARDLGVDYHYTSKRFHRPQAGTSFPAVGDIIPNEYKEDGLTPKQYDQEAINKIALGRIVCFGNGGFQGRAVGVRFVSEADCPDLLMSLYAMKAVETNRKALKTNSDRIEKMVSSPAIPSDEAEKLKARHGAAKVAGQLALHD
jgi:hypothetical protein